MSPRLVVVPCTIRIAREYVARMHRHHKPPQGALFALGCSLAIDQTLCGVAIVGRPVSRMLDDGSTAEITRLATDGTPNACSFLYGAARRACRELGYGRILTYTLASEAGVSLRASGWRCLGVRGGGSWSRDGRPRNDCHPVEEKLLWEAP